MEVSAVVAREEPPRAPRALRGLHLSSKSSSLQREKDSYIWDWGECYFGQPSENTVQLTNDTSRVLELTLPRNREVFFYLVETEEDCHVPMVSGMTFNSQVLQELSLTPGTSVLLGISYTPIANACAAPRMTACQDHTVTAELKSQQDGEEQILTLRIKSYVCEAVIGISPPVMDFGYIEVGKSVQQVVILSNLCDLPVHLTVELTSSATFLGEIRDTVTKECIQSVPVYLVPKQNYELVVIVNPHSPNPQYEKDIYIINHDHCNQKSAVKVRATILNHITSHQSSFYQLSIPDADDRDVIDFEDVVVDSQSLRSFQITNTIDEPIFFSYKEILPESLRIYVSDELDVLHLVNCGRDRPLTSQRASLKSSSKSDLFIETINRETPRTNSSSTVEFHSRTMSDSNKGEIPDLSINDLVKFFHDYLPRTPQINQSSESWVDNICKIQSDLDLFLTEGNKFPQGPEIVLKPRQTYNFYVVLKPPNSWLPKSMYKKHRWRKDLNISLRHDEIRHDRVVGLNCSLCASEMELDQSSINFGRILGGSRYDMKLYITNLSAIPLVYRLHKNANFFSTFLQFTVKGKGVIRPYGKDGIPISFVPTLMENSFNETIDIINVMTNSVKTVCFKAQIYRPLHFSIKSPGSMNLGTVTFGTQSETASITIKNTHKHIRTFEISCQNKSFYIEKALVNVDMIFQTASEGTLNMPEEKRTEIEEILEKLRQKTRIHTRKGHVEKEQKSKKEIAELESMLSSQVKGETVYFVEQMMSGLKITLGPFVSCEVTISMYCELKEFTKRSNYRFTIAKKTITSVLTIVDSKTRSKVQTIPVTIDLTTDVSQCSLKPFVPFRAVFPPVHTFIADGVAHCLLSYTDKSRVQLVNDLKSTIQVSCQIKYSSAAPRGTIIVSDPEGVVDGSSSRSLNFSKPVFLYFQWVQRNEEMLESECTVAECIISPSLNVSNFGSLVIPLYIKPPDNIFSLRTHSISRYIPEFSNGSCFCPEIAIRNILPIPITLELASESRGPLLQFPESVVLEGSSEKVVQPVIIPTIDPPFFSYDLTIRSRHLTRESQTVNIFGSLHYSFFIKIPELDPKSTGTLSPIDFGVVSVNPFDPNGVYPVASRKLIRIRNILNRSIYLQMSANIKKQISFFASESCTDPITSLHLHPKSTCELVVAFCPYLSEEVQRDGKIRSIIGGIAITGLLDPDVDSGRTLFSFVVRVQGRAGVSHIRCPPQVILRREASRDGRVTMSGDLHIDNVSLGLPAQYRIKFKRDSEPVCRVRRIRDTFDVSTMVHISLSVSCLGPIRTNVRIQNLCNAQESFDIDLLGFADEESIQVGLPDDSSCLDLREVIVEPASTGNPSPKKLLPQDDPQRYQLIMMARDPPTILLINSSSETMILKAVSDLPIHLVPHMPLSSSLPSQILQGDSDDPRLPKAAVGGDTLSSSSSSSSLSTLMTLDRENTHVVGWPIRLEPSCPTEFKVLMDESLHLPFLPECFVDNRPRPFEGRLMFIRISDGDDIFSKQLDVKGAYCRSFVSFPSSPIELQFILPSDKPSQRQFAISLTAVSPVLLCSLLTRISQASLEITFPYFVSLNEEELLVAREKYTLYGSRLVLTLSETSLSVPFTFHYLPALWSEVASPSFKIHLMNAFNKQNEGDVEIKFNHYSSALSLNCSSLAFPAFIYSETRSQNSSATYLKVTNLTCYENRVRIYFYPPESSTIEIFCGNVRVIESEQLVLHPNESQDLRIAFRTLEAFVMPNILHSVFSGHLTICSEVGAYSDTSSIPFTATVLRGANYSILPPALSFKYRMKHPGGERSSNVLRSNSLECQILNPFNEPLDFVISTCQCSLPEPIVLDSGDEPTTTSLVVPIITPDRGTIPPQSSLTVSVSLCPLVLDPKNPPRHSELEITFRHPKYTTPSPTTVPISVSQIQASPLLRPLRPSEGIPGSFPRFSSLSSVQSEFSLVSTALRPSTPTVFLLDLGSCRAGAVSEMSPFALHSHAQVQLGFSVSISSSLSNCLSLNPLSGVLSPGESRTVSATFHSRDPGVFSGYLHVKNLVEPSNFFLVRVRANVTDDSTDPPFTVLPRSGSRTHALGSVTVGIKHVRLLTITNCRSFPLELELTTESNVRSTIMDYRWNAAGRVILPSRSSLKLHLVLLTPSFHDQVVCTVHVRCPALSFCSSIEFLGTTGFSVSSATAPRPVLPAEQLDRLHANGNIQLENGRESRFGVSIREGVPPMRLLVLCPPSQLTVTVDQSATLATPSAALRVLSVPRKIEIEVQRSGESVRKSQSYLGLVNLDNPQEFSILPVSSRDTEWEAFLPDQFEFFLSEFFTVFHHAVTTGNLASEYSTLRSIYVLLTELLLRACHDASSSLLSLPCAELLFDWVLDGDPLTFHLDSEEPPSPDAEGADSRRTAWREPIERYCSLFSAPSAEIEALRRRLEQCGPPLA